MPTCHQCGAVPEPGLQCCLAAAPRKHKHATGNPNLALRIAYTHNVRTGTHKLANLRTSAAHVAAHQPAPNATTPMHSAGGIYHALTGTPMPHPHGTSIS